MFKKHNTGFVCLLKGKVNVAQIKLEVRTMLVFSFEAATYFTNPF